MESHSVYYNDKDFGNMTQCAMFDARCVLQQVSEDYFM